jgi:hypothetical protein
MNVPGVDVAAGPWPCDTYVCQLTDEPMGLGAGPQRPCGHYVRRSNHVTDEYKSCIFIGDVA